MMFRHDSAAADLRSKASMYIGYNMYIRLPSSEMFGHAQTTIMNATFCSNKGLHGHAGPDPGISLQLTLARLWLNVVSHSLHRNFDKRVWLRRGPCDLSNGCREGSRGGGEYTED